MRSISNKIKRNNCAKWSQKLGRFSYKSGLMFVHILQLNFCFFFASPLFLVSVVLFFNICKVYFFLFISLFLLLLLVFGCCYLYRYTFQFSSIHPNFLFYAKQLSMLSICVYISLQYVECVFVQPQAVQIFEQILDNQLAETAEMGTLTADANSP